MKEEGVRGATEDFVRAGIGGTEGRTRWRGFDKNKRGMKESRRNDRRGRR